MLSNRTLNYIDFLGMQPVANRDGILSSQLNPFTHLANFGDWIDNSTDNIMGLDILGTVVGGAVEGVGELGELDITGGVGTIVGVVPEAGQETIALAFGDRFPSTVQQPTPYVSGDNNYHVIFMNGIWTSGEGVANSAGALDRYITAPGGSVGFVHNPCGILPSLNDTWLEPLGTADNIIFGVTDLLPQVIGHQLGMDDASTANVANTVNNITAQDPANIVILVAHSQGAAITASAWGDFDAPHNVNIIFAGGANLAGVNGSASVTEVVAGSDPVPTWVGNTSSQSDLVAPLYDTPAIVNVTRPGIFPHGFDANYARTCGQIINNIIQPPAKPVSPPVVSPTNPPTVP